MAGSHQVFSGQGGPRPSPPVRFLGSTHCRPEGPRVQRAALGLRKGLQGLERHSEFPVSLFQGPTPRLPGVYIERRFLKIPSKNGGVLGSTLISGGTGVTQLLSPCLVPSAAQIFRPATGRDCGVPELQARLKATAAKSSQHRQCLSMCIVCGYRTG